MLNEIQETIGYRFNDISLLKTALTHSSYANEKRKENIKFNERLEFLGDSVLSLIVSEYLFRRFEDFTEGEMTRIRAIVVCESTLSLAARRINLGKHLYLGKGENKGGGRDRNSNLADAFEALIGAVYLDGGLQEAYNFLDRTVIDILMDTVKGKELFVDYKTKLQEVLQRDRSHEIKYILAKEEGPDHDKKFTTELYIDEELMGTGEGRNKKESEQNAAKEGYEKLCS